MSSTFHLALEVGDIDSALKFYVDMLGCESADKELPNWIDINFFGNELTLHASDPTNKPKFEAHHVDSMNDVMVPHFGVHLRRKDYNDIKKRIEENKIGYLLKPFIRFEGKMLEQETFFIKDPHCNILEIKSYSDSEVTYPETEPDITGHPEWGCP
ncbi:uncharacterized protein METZ01_LOCUS225593 [marine metagenome]|uniref:VOC domain-containing protein n=1 Tax=marine metagenome TaxID=408172 RepID=A0A382GCU4_9ZZZZ|tara:strand:+ start:338 stop:805 length:468 start_codon:yes stop_codon:yes gene_type:complete